eukprot:gene16986-19357_t
MSLVWISLYRCEGFSTPIAAANSTAVRETLKSPQTMICSILKNEQRYIDEWLEYHRFLGFDRVQLYDNAHNASAFIANLPEKFGSFVNITHFPGLGRQTEAYIDCMVRNRDFNTWAAFLDIDEFVVLRKHPNIKAFLQDLAPHGGSVVLNWSIMGSNNSLMVTPGPVVARFTLTSESPDKHIKTIAYLKHTKQPVIHNVLMLPGCPTVDQHGRAVNHTTPFVFNSTREVAYINHYYTKSLEEFILKRKRGWASSYKLNHLMTGPEKEVVSRILSDYQLHNKDTNVVTDTFARDFYMRNHLGTDSTHPKV